MAVRINDDTPDERFGGMSRNEFGAMLGDRIAEQYNGGTRMVSWNELEGSSYVVARCESNDNDDVRLGWFPLESPFLCDREGRVVCDEALSSPDILIDGNVFEFMGDFRGEVEPVKNWVFVDRDFTRCEGAFVIDEKEAEAVFLSSPERSKVFSGYWNYEFGDCKDIVPANLADTYVSLKKVDDALKRNDLVEASHQTDHAFARLEFGRKFDVMREGVMSGVIPVEHVKRACLEALNPAVQARARTKKGLGI